MCAGDTVKTYWIIRLKLFFSSEVVCMCVKKKMGTYMGYDICIKILSHVI